jgi:hypothetical protein
MSGLRSGLRSLGPPDLRPDLTKKMSGQVPRRPPEYVYHPLGLGDHLNTCTTHSGAKNGTRLDG